MMDNVLLEGRIWPLLFSSKTPQKISCPQVCQTQADSFVKTKHSWTYRYARNCVNKDPMRPLYDTVRLYQRIPAHGVNQDVFVRIITAQLLGDWLESVLIWTTRTHFGNMFLNLCSAWIIFILMQLCTISVMFLISVKKTYSDGLHSVCIE